MRNRSFDYMRDIGNPFHHFLNNFSSQRSNHNNKIKLISLKQTFITSKFECGDQSI